MNLKAMLAAGVTAVAMFSAAPPVKAEEICMDVSGFRACADPGDSFDDITLSNSRYREEIRITCHRTDGWEYTSRGNLTKEQVTDFVKAYCDGRGYTHR